MITRFYASPLTARATRTAVKPCTDTAQIADAPFRTLLAWHEDPLEHHRIHHGNGISYTEFKRLVWRELSARTRRQAVAKVRHYRSNPQERHVCAPPVASFRFA